MNQKDLINPGNLEKYAFLWSQTRLLIAAVALFIGGVPPILKFNPIAGLYHPLSSLLNLAWIISGVVSAYLLYHWYTNKQKVFGGTKPLDTAAFFINIITGFNLGLAGFLGFNLGMSIYATKPTFIITGLIYLAVAAYLFRRWNENQEKLF